MSDLASNCAWLAPSWTNLGFSKMSFLIVLAHQARNRTLILGSPRFVPFGAHLAQFRDQIYHPWLCLPGWHQVHSPLLSWSSWHSCVSPPPLPPTPPPVETMTSMLGTTRTPQEVYTSWAPLTPSPNVCLSVMTHAGKAIHLMRIIFLTYKYIYKELAATPRRCGITVASRLWLCIFNKMG